MSKYRFSDSEKYAVFHVLGHKCVWCKKPVLYKDCELDHVIPESLQKTEVDELIVHYGLTPEFELNSFYNWAPIHSICNKGKLARTFERAPFIGEILHKIKKQVPAIEKKYKETEIQFANSLTVAHLESSIKSNSITKKLIDELFEKHLSLKISTSNIYKALNCKTITINEKGKHGKKSPKQLYHVTYEQFESDNKSLDELNCLIKSDAIHQLISARENYFNYLKDYPVDEYGYETDSSHEFGMNFTLVSKKFISYTTNVSFYYSGAAHGQYAITGKSYYLDHLRPFELESIFFDSNSFIQTITPIAYDKMIKEIQVRDSEIEISENFPIEKEWLKPEFKTFDNYYFTDKTLVFIFNPYEVSAWALGAHFPEFTFEEIIELFPNESNLLNLIKSIKKSVNSPSKKKK